MAEKKSRSLRILIVEDNPDDAFLEVRQLQAAGFEVQWERVETRRDYVARLSPDLHVILCDYNLPSFNALQAVDILRERRLDVPLIVVTGALGDELAVECIKRGADDFLLKDRLARLGRAVEEVVEIRELRERRKKTEEDLAASMAEKGHVLERISDAFYSLDSRWMVTYWNRTAEQLAQALGRPGKKREEVLGRNFWELFPHLASTLLHQEFHRAMSAQASVHVEMQSSGRWFETHAYPSSDGLTVYVRDITERKLMEQTLRSSLKEKEMLLKEVHHRVKNNMQMLSSFLSLESRSVQDQEAASALRQSESRIHAMALLHERLYTSDNLIKIDLATYLKELAENLLRLHGDDDQITLDIRTRHVLVNVDTATPCGLIVNELVTNALKHAFPGDTRGTIRLDVGAAKGRAKLVVSDDGVGMPEAVPEQGLHLGLELVRLLAEQIGGELKVGSSGGSRFTVVFPITEAAI